MKLVLKTIFFAVFMLFFYQNCFAENQVSGNGVIEKLSSMRKELVLSFSGTSVEERYKTAIEKRKAAGPLIMDFLKSEDADRPGIKTLYEELIHWKGIVTHFNAESVRQPAASELPPLFRDIKDSLIFAPWDISRYYQSVKNREMLIQKKKRIEEKIAASFIYDQRQIPLSEVCGKLGKEDVFVDYHKVSDGTESVYAVFILTGKCEPELIIIENAVAVDRMVLDLETSISQREPAELFTQKIDRLSEKIWYPVEKKISFAKRLFVSGDSFISGVPFSILRSKNKEFLVLRYETSHMLSISSFFKEREPSKNLKIMGNAQLDLLSKGSQTLYANELASCPWYYPEEMKSFSEEFKKKLDPYNPVYITSADFSMKNVLEQLKKEGLFYIDSPDFSRSCLEYIDVLKVKNEILEHLGRDASGSIFMDQGFWTSDGFIIAEEVMYIGIKKNSSMILPFSQGLGRSFLEGESMVGIGTAFLTGGAYSVVGSPWEMPMDLPENILLPYILNYLNGKSEGKSLAQAQRRYLSLNWNAHPLDWGGVMVLK